MTFRRTLAALAALAVVPLATACGSSKSTSSPSTTVTAGTATSAAVTPSASTTTSAAPGTDVQTIKAFRCDTENQGVDYTHTVSDAGTYWDCKADTKDSVKEFEVAQYADATQAEAASKRATDAGWMSTSQGGTVIVTNGMAAYGYALAHMPK